MNPDTLQALLQKCLSADTVEVEDLSASHARHPEARRHGGGHYAVTIIADRFRGKSLLERHRLVYRAVANAHEEIHALQIVTFTPEEAGRRQ